MAVRSKKSYTPADILIFRKQAIAWAQQYDHVQLFSDNGYSYPAGGFANLLAAGCAGICPIEQGNTFASIQEFHTIHQDWLIGYLSYDLKNEIEDLQSKNPDYAGFPAAYFYVPRHIIHFTASEVSIQTMDNPEQVYQQIRAYIPVNALPAPGAALQIHHRTSKETYISHVEQIKNHILEGDVYELNYCMEFYARDAEIQPWQVYEQLNAKSPMPFSVYSRIKDFYLVCASPERFLKKTGRRLLSQPIKGTARRGTTAEEDEQLKLKLRHNEKELAENMMIVDLVRNDLARSAVAGSVVVEEMFGIYTFPQVHQMISSVRAHLRPEVPFMEALRYAFPMGSMTGAPKIKAMELIDQYESAYRGLYSGAMGYITPEADFDFAVVIRSIVYNAVTHYLTFQAGSAITFDSDAQQEYEECLLKAKAIRSVLDTCSKPAVPAF